MTRRVIVRSAARRDIRDAKAWYRDISRDLAKDFVRRVDDATALIVERPLAFPVVHRTFRSASFFAGSLTRFSTTSETTRS
jgi:plasmid stabilization system protein ParE